MALAAASASGAGEGFIDTRALTAPGGFLGVVGE